MLTSEEPLPPHTQCASSHDVSRRHKARKPLSRNVKTSAAVLLPAPQAIPPSHRARGRNRIDQQSIADIEKPTEAPHMTERQKRMGRRMFRFFSNRDHCHNGEECAESQRLCVKTSPPMLKLSNASPHGKIRDKVRLCSKEKPIWECTHPSEHNNRDVAAGEAKRLRLPSLDTVLADQLALISSRKP